MDSNYNFYMAADLSKYIGEWVAIVEGKVVAHSRNFKKAYQEAKTGFPNKTPFLTVISEKQTLIL